MKALPSQSSSALHGAPQKPAKKAKTNITKRQHFDTLVARYYPAVYSFASRLTEDPMQAVLLTQDAFNSTRNQLGRPRGEIARVTMLLNAVIRAGLTPA